MPSLLTGFLSLPLNYLPSLILTFLLLFCSSGKRSVWSITREQINYYTTQFFCLQSDPLGVIPGAEAKEFFERSKLPITDLRKIWQLSDVSQVCFLIKVEKILKGSLDLILSLQWTSVKIQIMGGKVCLRCKSKILLGVVNKLLERKVCWQHPSMFCFYTFPTHNLNFHLRRRWWDWIQATF